MSDTPIAVQLTPKGRAFCDFAFSDGPALGLDDSESIKIAERLIDQWDGSESLASMYRRTELWPEEITDANTEKK